MPRKMRLVKNDDGTWRSWDNSTDDCMDNVEIMDVVDATRPPAAGFASYRVYIDQVNQTCINVTAQNDADARKIAKEQWHRDWAHAEVISVEKYDDLSDALRTLARDEA